MKTTPLWLLLLAFGLVACSPKADPKPAETTGSATSGTATAGEPEKPAEPVVADSLKTDAYKYLGLENRREMTYEFTKVKGGSPESGSQKIVPKGEASETEVGFEIVRAGALTELGNEQIVAKADGVYTTSSQFGALEKPMLTLPSEVTIGKTWESSYELTGPDNKPLVFKATSKVLRQEKLKVIAGEFDTMLVTMTAQIKTGGKTANVNGKIWYAAGVGTVKLTLEGKSGDGLPIFSTIELRSQG